MLYRIKITKCFDIVIKLDNDKEAIMYAWELYKQFCKGGRSLYVHILERRDDYLVDKGLIYSSRSIEK